MNWYTACCLYTTTIKGKTVKRGGLAEYRYFLLKAGNDNIARAKGLRIGKAKQHSYKNSAGEEVSWTFEKLIDIKEVLSEEVTEGTEMYHQYIGNKKHPKKMRYHR